MRLLLGSFLLFAACATPAPGDEPAPDAGSDPGDKPVPAGHDCAAAEHTCATACTPALPNNPSNGCAFGCYEPCPSPDHGHATCSTLGTCDLACDPGFQRIGDHCAAAACSSAGYQCGTYVDGLGASSPCGECEDVATCGEDHRCHVPADRFEPDDAPASAHQLGDFNDADDREVVMENLTFHTTTDEDWFVLHISDGFDAGNPDAYVELGTSPYSSVFLGQLGAPHELSVWFKCDTQDAGSTVFCGDQNQSDATDPVRGKGCSYTHLTNGFASVSPSCTGTQDSGTMYVRIKRISPMPSGEDYALRVSVY